MKMRPHSIEEAEGFFLRLCKAVPLPVKGKEMQRHQRDHPGCNLEGIHGYALPFCIENEWIYQREKGYHERYLQRKRAYFGENDLDEGACYSSPGEKSEILFFFDLDDGQISAKNGGRDIADCLTVYIGVTPEQVLEKPFLFTNYQEALRKLQSDGELLKRFVEGAGLS